MPKQTMTKEDALWVLRQEWDTRRRSMKALMRLRRACKVLGFDDALTRYVECMTNYRDTPDGEIYPTYL